MKSMKLIQGVLWGAFLLYYCASKFLAGYQGYSHAYAIQVSIIVLATAILPYYATLWMQRVARRGWLPVTLFLPSLLAMSGYAAFFYIFIAPNYPDITASAVIPRGLMPGLAISAIMVLPVLIRRLSVLKTRAA